MRSIHLSASLQCRSPRTKSHPLRLFLLLALALLLQHLLDDLLLLDQEGTHDAVPDAVAAPRATVRALDGLLGLGDGCVLAGPEGGDLWENVMSVLIRALVCFLAIFNFG